LKVQHKQIRQKDLQDRDNAQHEGYGASEGNNFQRTQFGSSLPPSGPMASQNLWYDSRKTPPNAEGPQDATGCKQDEGTEMTSTSTAGETPLGLSNNESSPLASLGQLQSALPEVPGNSTPEAGEPYHAS